MSDGPVWVSLDDDIYLALNKMLTRRDSAVYSALIAVLRIEKANYAKA